MDRRATDLRPQRLLPLAVAALAACATPGPRLPPGPAVAPQPDEVRLEPPWDELARNCDETTRKLARLGGDRVLKAVVTRSPRWGTVYRADTEAEPAKAPDEPAIIFRTICWRKIFLVRPLEMGDPAETVPPLE